MSAILPLGDHGVIEIQSLDIAMVVIILIATARGFVLGLVREAFSLVALGGAYLAVQLFSLPVADWLQEKSHGEIGAGIAPWVAGAGLALATITAVIYLGRVLQRGVKLAGLSWADRFGGSALGAAEGVLVAALLIVIGAQTLGRDHPAFSNTVSLAVLERVEQLAESSDIDVDVAAPPRAF